MLSDFAAVSEHLQRGITLYLPTVDSAFAAAMVRGKGKQGRIYVYPRAGTFLTDAMLGDDQVPLPAADNKENSVLLKLWRDRDATDNTTTPMPPFPPATSGLTALPILPLTGSRQAPTV
jgi:hypothetical protein